jgi:hypothetical protein
MPGLMALGRLIRLPPEVSGVLLSTIFLFAALVLLYRLVRLDHSQSVALWTLVLLLSYPFALFLGTAYSEALVLMCAVGAWLAARRGLWWLAGFAVAGALLGKIVFIVLLVPLSLEILEWDGRLGLYPDRNTVRRLVALWLPPFTALGAWMVYLFIEFREPLRFLTALRAWGRGLGLPIGPILDIFRPGIALGIRGANVIDAMALLLLAALTIYVYRRVRPTYAVSLGLVAATLTFEPTLQSNARHISILFPFFLGLAVMTQHHRNLRILLLALQLPIAVLYISRFAVGKWAG